MDYNLTNIKRLARALEQSTTWPGAFIRRRAIAFAVDALRAMNQPHVYPTGDIKQHLCRGRECWCRPIDKDGVIIHHALDRRELCEKSLNN